MSFKSWIKAARLRTLPLALSCTLTGTALALSKDSLNGLILGLAVLTTVLLQVLSNFANDYGDFKKGTDINADRQDRALASGDTTERQMKMALYLFSGLSFISGVSLLAVSFDKEELQLVLFMVFVGIAAIWAAIKYTSGKNAYGYRGLGDALYVLIIGGLSVAVLNLNNLRDIVSDEESGKITIPVRLGFKKAKVYHLILFLIIWVCLVVISVLSQDLWYFVLLLPLILHLKHLKYLFNTTESSLLDTELKKIAVSTFGISVVFLVIELLG